MKKINGLCDDGVMRSVMCLTEEIVSHHLKSGKTHIECIFMAQEERTKAPENRSGLYLSVFWDRNDFMVTLLEAKGQRYGALSRIEGGAFKVPLWVVQKHLSGEFVDTSQLEALERKRFNRLMGALQAIRDEEEIHIEEGLKRIVQPGSIGQNLDQQQAA